MYWFNTPAINAPAVGFTATGAVCTTLPNCARVLPAHTYPAYNMFGPYNNGGEIYDPTTGSEQVPLQPRIDHFYLPSLTIDYDFGPFTAHSITGFQSDSIRGFNDNTYRTGAPAASNTPAYPANFYYTFPQALFYNNYRNDHDATSEELRFVSNPNGTPFSWIAGLYYYRDRLHYWQTAVGNLAEEFAVVQGTTSKGILGYLLPPNDYISTFDSYNRTRNESVYLDVNYNILHNLKLEAGVRYSRDTLGITTFGYGLNNHGVMTATLANGGEIIGNSSGSIVTPKAGVTYEVNDRDMVYATASKGYRAGGYNATPQFALAGCQLTLAQLGLGSPPTHYDPDSVWTYELGSKWRERDGRLQVDASVYRTNWSHVQSQLSIPSCGQYTANAASAVVQGGDLQGALKLGDVTLSTAVEFTDATYKGAVYLPTTTGARQMTIADRDRLLGVPLWSGSAGIRYDLHIFDKVPFLRADYDFSSGVRRSTGPTTVGYTPDVYKAKSVGFLTVGAGVNYTSQLQLLFNVKNVTNTQTPLLEYGGSTPTRSSPVLFGTTFRPREYDLDALYHF
jgi:iron complex outermembrane recepter protein